MSSGGSSALGARLVEMDRLLRGIQAELVPGREPAPLLVDDDLVGDHAPDAMAAVRDVAPDPQASVPDVPPLPELHPPRQVPTPDPQIHVLTEVSASLVASMRELLTGYERMLPGRSAPRPTRRASRRPTGSPDVTLSAAPFPNLDALHAFEQAVSRLPGVREAAVQGYEGTDRAIIAVRLDQPNP